MYVVLGYRHSSGKTKDGKEFDSYVVYFGRSVDDGQGKGFIFDPKKVTSFYVYLSPDEFKTLGIEVGQHYDYYFNDRGYIAKDSLRRVK